jgi:CRP-like cAMP-binding protein
MDPPRFPPAVTSPDIAGLLLRFPPRKFGRGETIILNTRHQEPAGPGTLAYVVEGLVRGAWHGPFIAPDHRATTIVAGDGRWVGADAFKYGANLYRYDALTPTSAAIVPLEYLETEAPRAILLDTLRCVSVDWCTAASVLGLGSHTLRRRTLLLLYNLARLHPRPEIEVRQQDVAELLGVARQSLQPVLKRLEKEGLVTAGYGQIVVGDADALLATLREPAQRVRTRAAPRAKS